MMNIVALSKEKGSSYTEHSSVVTLDSASILKIAISREDIKSFSRVNNDLIIELNDHEKITIKNFFTVGPNGQHSDLVLEDPHDGALSWLENPGTDAAVYTSIDSLAEVGTQTTANEYVGAWTIAGAALLGIGAMLLGSSKSDHRHSDNDDSDSESGSKTTTATDNTVVNGETANTTAPAEPSGVQLSDDGKTITGKAEAGSTVTVNDGNGEELGHVTVGSDGSFSVTLPTAQTSGQSLTVTATDTAGNTSPAATVTAPTIDTTAPAEPSGVQLSDDGKTITGKGEAGSTISVKDGNGKELGYVTVGSDGTFSMTLPTAQTNGQSLSVTAADAAGNTSSAATVTAPAIDTTAPTEPSGMQLSDEGKTISGKAEAGSTVTVKDAEGNTLGSATVGSDGTFTITLPTAQTNGQSLSVTATDAAGNTSSAATVTAPAIDTTAPTEPSGVQLSDDGKTITGKGEAGSTISVKDGNGKELGHVTVGSDGTFSMTLPTAQTSGQSLSVTATDAAGNTSPAATVTAPAIDTTAPTEPSGVQLSDDGKTITGKGEAGSTISVKDGNGKELGHVTVGSDGTFSVTLPTAQTNGQSLSVTAADAAGNTSPAATVTAPTIDTTAPAEPSGVQLSDDGKTITGKGEAGSTISVKDGNGKELGHVTVGSDGTFSMTLPTAQTSGQSLSVTATDAAGNTSPAATVTAPTIDTTAPTEPSGMQLSDEGKTISGKAEAGSTVTVKDAEGNTLGSATVGSDGTFTITLPTAQTSGQSLSVTAADAAGNTSPAATVTAPTIDTTAPAEPSGVQLSDDGKTITGKGEAGSTISVKDGNGKELGHVTVGSDGTFSMTLPTAQTSGQSLSVTATDAAGNTSSAATVTAPTIDTTAPTEPSGMQLSDEGKTISGKAEAGSTVTVKDAEGNTLGSATVGSDGTFTITLPTAQTSGQSLSVTATDAAGNTSSAATVTAPAIDTTAPTEPSGVQLSDDGKTITGKGEAGSTISVKDGNGKELGHVTVGSDGTFSVTLPTAQTNGQSLSVTAADAAGNTSPAATVTAPAIDTTAPTEPSGVQLSDDGKTITGKGEAGSTISVKDGNGKELGHVTVGSDGTFSVTLPTAQTNGQSLSVTAADAAGNTSPAATVTAPAIDTTAPTEPSGMQLSDEGKTISGKAEAGSTVTVKDGNGKELGHVTVGSDGTFSMTLPTAQTNGQSLTVTATDAAGNTSSAATVTAPTIDTTAPAEPTATLSEDGKTITGQAEAGSTITVKDAQGNTLGSEKADDTGSFSINLPSAQTNGQSLTVTATDAAGNTSPAATVTAPTIDTTPPAEPTATLSEDGKTITGQAEAGSTVSVKDDAGNELTHVIADKDGSFTLNLPSAQTNGQSLTVTATDAAGNTSQPATITAPIVDTTPPAEPTATLSEDGKTITGQAEAGSTVSVKDDAGNELTHVIADKDGSFTLNLPSAQTNGQSLTVTATDTAGNTSPAATVTAPTIDTTPPAEPTATLSEDGKTITGKAEAGSTVSVKDDAGNELTHVIADKDGSFTLNLPSAQTNGQTLSVTATDAAGNASSPATITAPIVDTTPPAEPTATLSDDGTTITGQAEAGSTVSVKDDAGNELTHVIADKDGSFTLNLPSAQTTGQSLTVTATDAAGNTSPAATVTAPTIDTTPPAEPTATLSEDGKTITGKAEAGSTVSVKDDAGNELTHVLADKDGSFTLNLPSAQTNGQSLTVTATDAAGNTSPAATVTAPTIDTTAPAEPTATLSEDGKTITGQAEAGSTITVKDAQGNTLGSEKADDTGSFSINLPSAQTNGQSLTVTATDAAGNTSPAATVTAPTIDTTPPAEPTATLSEDGKTITGKAEAGSTVSVKDDAGNELTHVIADKDGSFTLNLPSAQTTGQSLTVTATDAAGNTSPAATVTAPTIDTTPPAEPTATLSEDGKTITGQAEAGSTITVKDAQGNTLGSEKADDTGSFSINLPRAQTNGQSLTVTATDAAGNTSPAATVTAPTIDTTPPAEPTATLSEDGKTITGQAEAGSTITVKDAQGNTLGSEKADDTGSFSINLPSAQTNGQTLSVTATDAAGNTSQPATITAPIVDTTPPAEPTATLSDDGTTITGQAEAGSTVSVKDDAGNELTHVIADKDGSFTLNLPSAQTNGQSLTVTATDAAGNTSQPATITAPIVDTTPPAEPTATLSDDGTTITGQAEAGSTVSVKDDAGNELTHVIADKDGSFTLNLPSAQTNGQTLSVTATDAAGNTSQPATITAPIVDTTPPAEPTATLSDDGTTITGQAEAGSTVSVKDDAGNELTHVIADKDGSFTLNLPSAQTTGQSLKVTATDAAGNTSPAATVTAPTIDTTPPAEPTATLSEDGKTITGQAEAGSTITVKDAQGNTLGSEKADDTGSFSINLPSAQTNGQTLSVTATDAAGNTSQPATITAPIVDTTPPAEPTATLSEDGKTITGQAEAGSTITVKDAQGNTLGSEKADDTGSFSINLPSAQTNGQTLTVTATDAAGNTSQPATITAPIVDTTPPAEPTATLSDDGTTITGQAEAGSTVSVKDDAGNELTHVIADKDGSFTLNLPSAQTTGQSLTVTATDAAGNTSPAATVTAPTIDTTPPAEPTATLSEDGKTITGQAEAGSTITVKDAQGNTLGSEKADDTGSFSINLPSAQTNGQTLSVTATDAAGNTSQPATITAPIVDTTPPAEPIATLSEDGKTITGQAEAGSTITVKDAQGNTLGSEKADDTGSFSINLPSAQTNGQTLTVTATDAAGNTSQPATITAPIVDTTPPAEPIATLSEDGKTITGQAEAGSTITVKDAQGNTLGSEKADDTGSFSINLPSAQTNGQTLTVTATDAAGNTSQPATITAPIVDTTPPAEPTATLSEDGTTITGQAEAGSTVSVKDDAGNELTHVIADKDGSFTLNLPSAQTNGQSLTVTATDAAGNTSLAATVTAPTIDTTAPAEPTATLSDDGTTITGQAEAGSTVSVKDDAGNELTHVIADKDGSFTLNLPSAQTNGQTLTVTATDAAGNTSPAATVTAPTIDTTAPAEPTATLSEDGKTITGQAEAGSTITVKDAQGNTLGSEKADDTGSFSINLPSAQTNGQSLTVTATDATGNTSPAATVTAPTIDTTPPAEPTATLSDDGTTITGQAEAGSTVSVKDDAGNELTHVIADKDGSFTLNLPSAQTNGQTLSVTATDAAGNTSQPATITAPIVDTTPPAEPTATLSDDGTTITGQAEAGSTITVKDAQGNTLGSEKADDTGSFSIKLTAAQTNGQTLSVTATDAAGNTSQPATVLAQDTTPPEPESLIANPDTHTSTVTAVQDNLNGTNGNILQIAGLTALGIDISLLSSNNFNIKVEDNTSEDVTLNVSGSIALSLASGLAALVSNGLTADLSVIDTATGQVVQTLSDAIKISAGVVSLNYSGSVLIQGLTSGNYTVAVSSASASSQIGKLISAILKLSVGTSIKVSVTDSVQYTYGETTGNVLTSDTAGDVADTGSRIHVTSVTSDTIEGASTVSVASSGTTTITGEYGVLTISADGSYTYQPSSDTSNIGKIDVFTYTITDASGQTATANLTLTIEGTHSTAVADSVSISDTTVLATGTSLTYTTNTLVSALAISKNGSVTKTATESFTVASGTTLNDASLVLKFTAANSDTLNNSTTTVSGTLTILNVTTGVSESTTLSASLALASLTPYNSTQTISLSSLGLSELTEGNYSVSFSYSASNAPLTIFGSGGTALTVTSSLSGTSIDTTHHYTESETASGNILNGTDSDSVADTFGSQYQSFTITGNNASGTSVSYTVSGGDKSITDSSGSSVSGDTVTLYGKYGTLVLSNDGSYTYTLKAGIDTSTITAKEMFSYSLNDSDGTSSTAKLTIDLHPVITGSANADTISSTAYDDTFTTGSGADTVVYKLLADDSTGGNGSDTWTDFSTTNGDHIDVSALLVGWDKNTSSLGNYISVSHTDNTTVVSIDRDGTGSAYSSTTLVTLDAQNVTLDELIDHHTSS